MMKFVRVSEMNIRTGVSDERRVYRRLRIWIGLRKRGRVSKMLYVFFC
jgi:hypothetical protein